jgi:hypothetical protein
MEDARGKGDRNDRPGKRQDRSRHGHGQSKGEGPFSKTSERQRRRSQAKGAPLGKGNQARCPSTQERAEGGICGQDS